MESIVQWRVALRFGAWRRVLVSRRAALGVVFAFGAAAVLVGCGREVPQSSPAAALNGVEPVRAEMARIEAAFNAAPSAAPADREALEALLARFEPQFDVSAERFESESVEGVAFTLPGQPDLGVRFETLRAWGVDADAVDTPLAARIEATGVAYFGWETLLDDVNKAYIDGLADAVGNDENAAAQEALAVATPMVEEFSLTGARLVVDGFILHAEENSAGTIAPAVDEMADLFMTSARANRAYSIDRMMFEELVFSLLQSQDGMNTRTEYRVPVAVAEDYRRGDLGAAYTRDLELKMVLDGPLDGVDASPDEDESDAPSLTATFAGSMGLFVVEDMALAPLYEHLARGEAPPMSDTDVMSLGVWRNFGEAYTINDAPLYSTEYWEADLSSFHWLIPSAIGYETKGGVYDLAGVMSMIEGFSAADPEAAAGLASVRALLAETGLERIAFDVEGTLNWSPQTGASAARSDLAVADIMDLTMETEGGLPTYDEIAAIDYSAVQWGAAADDDVGETSHWDELGALFASRSTIASHRTALVDHGGLEKGFAVAVASANLAAEYGEANPLAGSDPVDLRQTASTLIRVSGGQMGVVAPQLVGFAQAAADFIDESGALIVALSPAAPFAVMDLVQRLQTGAITPEQAIEETGLTVEHLPSDTE